MPQRRLILIPTAVEARHVQASLERLVASGDIVEICGFGVVVAAARAMQAIAQHQPSELVLLGIAGALDARLHVGEAFEFSEVLCYGIGVGCGAEYRSAGCLGWMQWDGMGSVAAAEEAAGIAISDRLPLAATHSRPMQLLTCCAGSSSDADVELRRKEFPDAAAEDMEGFAVAAAAKLAGLNVRIIRGISNVAGNRNPAEWKSSQAMHAAVKMLWDA